MIPDVDEALHKLLNLEIPIKDNEIDVLYDQPKRDWASRISKPTINLFLFDIRENLRLRGSEQFTRIDREDGTVELRRNPVRMDFRYLLTVWIKDAEDEHLLLASALMGLLRNPFLPAYCLSEQLKIQPVPIPLEVANFPPEAGPVDKFTDLWGVLDNEMRPGIILTITLSLDPYLPLVFPQVKTREANFVLNPPHDLPASAGKEKILSKKYHAHSGILKSDKYDLSTLTLILVERQMPVGLKEDGRFALPKLAEGEYHIDILYNKKVLKRQKFTIPGAIVEIQV
ncbi:MAG: DUF4255 domain-containing protein [Chloroflexota bacterium]